MSQICELTGKRPAYGNKVSHSNIKTRTRWLPNLKSKKYLIPELGQTISLLLSTRAIRTVDKFGSITTAIMNAKDESLSDRLLRVKRAIYKSRVIATAGGAKKDRSAPKAEKKAAPVKAAAPKAEAKAKKAAPKKASAAKAKK